MLPKESRTSRIVRTRNRPAYRRALISTVVLIAAVCINRYAFGVNFTVTNTNDSGPGSLRQAIMDANLQNGVQLLLCPP